MTEPPGGGTREPDRYRFSKGWSDHARVQAIQQVREAAAQGNDLREVGAQVAEVIREVLHASRVTITLLKGDQYRDLVNVGELYEGQVRVPERVVYPTSSYPAATSFLMKHQGYISTSSNLAVVREYIEGAPQATVGCFMGVPIVAAGDVLGELWALRAPDKPAFISEDLDMATDFATQFGGQLPRLIEARRATDPDW